MTPVNKSSHAFAQYAHLSGEELPSTVGISYGLADLQVRLARWQQSNFGGSKDWQLALGAAEEVGELCHALLKRSQRIRGMEDPAVYKEAVGDAIADVTVFLIQLASSHRLDFFTLLVETANKVMERNWTAGGHEQLGFDFSNTET